MKLKKYFLTLSLMMLGFVLYGQKDTTRHIIDYGYRYEYFSNDLERSFHQLQYGYRFENKNQNYNTLLVSAVYQRRQGNEALQYIVDYYPTHKKGYYFFSMRYSDSNLFPTVMTIGEFFRSFNGNMEWSAGMRYLHVLDYYNIYAITGTYGIYYGNFYTYVRPMFNILEDGYSYNAQIVTRYYDGEGKNYLEASYLYGEDVGVVRPYTAVENSFGLNTNLVRLKVNMSLPKNWWLSFGIDNSNIMIPKANGSFNKLNITGLDVMIKKKF